MPLSHVVRWIPPSLPPTRQIYGAGSILKLQVPHPPRICKNLGASPGHEGDMISAPSVFISYTRTPTDSTWASNISAHLQTAGCKVFRDVETLQPGDDYIQILDEVIAT